MCPPTQTERDGLMAEKNRQNRQMSPSLTFLTPSPLRKAKAIPLPNQLPVLNTDPTSALFSSLCTIQVCVCVPMWDVREAGDREGGNVKGERCHACAFFTFRDRGVASRQPSYCWGSVLDPAKLVGKNHFSVFISPCGLWDHRTN